MYEEHFSLSDEQMVLHAASIKQLALAAHKRLATSPVLYEELKGMDISHLGADVLEQLICLNDKEHADLLDERYATFEIELRAQEMLDDHDAT